MNLSPPLRNLDIHMQDSGFYDGFNRIVVIASKALLAVVVLWCLVFPQAAGEALSAAKNWSFNYLNWYYIFSVALFITTCLVIAIVPSFGPVSYTHLTLPTTPYV